MKKNTPGCNCCEGCPPITCDDATEEVVDRVDVTINAFTSSYQIFENATRYFIGDLTDMNGTWVYERDASCEWPSPVSDVFSLSGQVYEVVTVDVNGCPATYTGPFAATGTLDLGRSISAQIDGSLFASHSFEINVSYTTFFGLQNLQLLIPVNATFRCLTEDMVMFYNPHPCASANPVVGEAEPIIT